MVQKLQIIKKVLNTSFQPTKSTDDFLKRYKLEEMILSETFVKFCKPKMYILVINGFINSSGLKPSECGVNR